MKPWFIADILTSSKLSKKIPPERSITVLLDDGESASTCSRRLQDHIYISSHSVKLLRINEKSDVRPDGDDGTIKVGGFDFEFQNLILLCRHVVSFRFDTTRNSNKVAHFKHNNSIRHLPSEVGLLVQISSAWFHQGSGASRAGFQAGHCLANPGKAP